MPMENGLSPSPYITVGFGAYYVSFMDGCAFSRKAYINRTESSRNRHSDVARGVRILKIY
jgi:hypothetical protein